MFFIPQAAFYAAAVAACDPLQTRNLVAADPDGEQVRYHLAGYGKCGPVAVSFSCISLS